MAAPFARGMEALAADLAMERTRFEVRFGEPLPEAAWSPRGIDHARILRVAQPRRRVAAPGAHRLGRRTLAPDAGDQDA